MNITFCGHRDFISSKEIELKFNDIIEKFAIYNDEITCLSGGYGHFDLFAAHRLRKLKAKFKNINSVLVIPYQSIEMKNRLDLIKDYYDSIIYPPLELVPKKIAIIKRNEWMIDNSDVLIAYLQSTIGGAARTYEYATKKQLKIINLNDK